MSEFCSCDDLEERWDLLTRSIERPFTLRWKHHEISKAHLGDSFDEIVKLLKEAAVEDEMLHPENDRFSYYLE